MRKDSTNTNELKLGVAGFGRIGKLTVWHHIARRYFKEIVVNIGRESGTSLQDIAHYAERDSTYGRLHAFLYGQAAKPVISDVDENTATMMMDGTRVKFLRDDRLPRDIGWRREGVRIVVDTTGQFLDPTLPAEHPKGSARGHLDAGADKVVLSAPFQDRGQKRGHA